jgi:hypothetical protein
VLQLHVFAEAVKVFQQGSHDLALAISDLPVLPKRSDDNVGHVVDGYVAQVLLLS